MFIDDKINNFIPISTRSAHSEMEIYMKDGHKNTERTF